MIAVAAATGREIEIFLKRLRKKKEYMLEEVQFIDALLEDIPVVIVLTGVGIKRSRSAILVLLKNHDIHLLISAGFAGSLRVDLKVGDIIVGSSVCKLNNEIHEKIELLDVDSDYRKGIIVSSRRFINSSNEKGSLSSVSSADCVDMESWSVARVAAENGIPVVGIRAISDNFRLELPDMGKLFNRDTTINFYGAVRYFLKNPGHLYSFYRFMYIDSRKAAISLSKVLVQLIPELNSYQ